MIDGEMSLNVVGSKIGGSLPGDVTNLIGLHVRKIGYRNIIANMPLVELTCDGVLEGQSVVRLAPVDERDEPVLAMGFYCVGRDHLVHAEDQ